MSVAVRIVLRSVLPDINEVVKKVAIILDSFPLE